MGMRRNHSKRIILTSAQWADVAVATFHYQGQTGRSKKDFYQEKFESLVYDTFELQGKLPAISTFYTRVSEAETKLNLYPRQAPQTDPVEESAPESGNIAKSGNVASNSVRVFGCLAANPAQKVRIILPVGQAFAPASSPHNTSDTPAHKRRTDWPAPSSRVVWAICARQHLASVLKAVCSKALLCAAQATKAVSVTLFNLANCR